MNATTDSKRLPARNLQRAIDEVYPESVYDSVPDIHQYDALETYRAIDDEALLELPDTLAAHLFSQLNQLV